MTASSSGCSDPRVRARPRCCALLRASSCPMRARSPSMASGSRRCRCIAARIGMVFQSYALFPHLTVAENIGFRPRCARHRRARTSTSASTRCWRWCGSRAWRPLCRGNCRAASSSAWRWRARLITRPKVLLLDEPLGALDRRLRQEMQVELREIQRETGVTAIFVTHDQEEALTLSDRIAIINEGRLIQIGAPQTVYERPANIFAANFLGDANVFRGTPVKEGLGSPTGRSSTTPTPSTGAAIVRPEKLRVAAGRQKVSGNSLIGRDYPVDLFRRQRHLSHPHGRARRCAASRLHPEPDRRCPRQRRRGHGELGHGANHPGAAMTIEGLALRPDRQARRSCLHRHAAAFRRGDRMGIARRLCDRTPPRPHRRPCAAADAFHALPDAGARRGRAMASGRSIIATGKACSAAMSMPDLLDLIPPLRRFVPPARVIDKYAHSAFEAPIFQKTLDELRADTIIFTGVETDVCVLATALTAIDRGYRTILVSDAIASSVAARSPRFAREHLTRASTSRSKSSTPMHC